MGVPPWRPPNAFTSSCQATEAEEEVVVAAEDEPPVLPPPPNASTSSFQLTEWWLAPRLVIRCRWIRAFSSSSSLPFVAAATAAFFAAAAAAAAAADLRNSAAITRAVDSTSSGRTNWLKSDGSRPRMRG